MKLSGVHLLLTYECNFECDHCFVWGSPRQQGTLSPKQIPRVLEQSKQLGTVEWIYFEGGEPFLNHAVARGGGAAGESDGLPGGNRLERFLGHDDRGSGGVPRTPRGAGRGSFGQ